MAIGKMGMIVHTGLKNIISMTYAVGIVSRNQRQAGGSKNSPVSDWHAY